MKSLDPNGDFLSLGKMIQNLVESRLHSNILKKLTQVIYNLSFELIVCSEEDGLVYEAAWMFCYVFDMIRIMKLTVDRSNVFHIVYEDLLDKPHKIQVETKAFLGTQVSSKKCTDWQHALTNRDKRPSHFSTKSEREIKVQLQILKANATVARLYDDLQRQYYQYRGDVFKHPP